MIIKYTEVRDIYFELISKFKYIEETDLDDERLNLIKYIDNIRIHDVCLDEELEGVIKLYNSHLRPKLIISLKINKQEIKNA